MAQTLRSQITVTSREQVGRNVRLTMSTGYALTVPPSHPLAQDCDSTADAAKRVVPKTAEEWTERIAQTQKLLSVR